MLEAGPQRRRVEVRGRGGGLWRYSPQAQGRARGHSSPARTG